MIEFNIINKDNKARRGTLKLQRGIIETPQFMPVGTQATVKALKPEDLSSAGASIILVNAYHLYIRPGLDLIEKFKGVHGFMNWKAPILSDSGGFQVFSLSSLRKLSEEGVTFSTPVDGGKKHFISPEKAIAIQETLDTDISMCFDECTPYPSTYEETKKSMELSLRWAERCKKAHIHKTQSLWGILQGGMFEDLRSTSAKAMNVLDFEGYAIGGLGVGEDKSATYKIINHTTPLMEEKKPRYLMGFGMPEDIIEGVNAGIDLFDCVIPTRNARHGKFYTSNGIIRIKNNKHRDETLPIDEKCSCYCCKNYSRSYIAHLLQCEEVLGILLGSIHNTHYYLNLMKNIRTAIENNLFLKFREEFYKSQILK